MRPVGRYIVYVETSVVGWWCSGSYRNLLGIFLRGSVKLVDGLEDTRPTTEKKVGAELGKRGTE